jgi:hypothetical protein
MVIARRDLREVVNHAPLGGQRWVPAARRLIHTDQLPVLGPLRQPLLQLRDEDRLLLSLGLEVAGAAPYFRPVTERAMKVQTSISTCE